MRALRFVPLFLIPLATIAALGGESTASWAKWSRERAEWLENHGLYDDAREEWMVLSRLLPNDVEPLSRAAVLAVETPGYFGKELTPDMPYLRVADQLVRDAVARWGQGDPGIAYALGRVHYACKRWGQAWRTLEEARLMGFDPVRTRFWRYRAAVNRWSMLLEQGADGARAVKELSELLATQPGHPDEHSLRVDLAAAHKLNQEPELAIKILEEEIAKYPGAPDAHYLLARILEDKGQLDLAEKRCRETMVHASASYGDKTYRDALYRLCEVQIKMGKLADAKLSADQYGELEKDTAEGLYLQGHVAQVKEDFETAVRFYRRAARLAPTDFQTLINLQQVLFQLHEEEESKQIKERLEELRKGRDEEMKGAPPMMGTPPSPSKR